MTKYFYFIFSSHQVAKFTTKNTIGCESTLIRYWSIDSMQIVTHPKSVISCFWLEWWLQSGWYLVFKCTQGYSIWQSATKVVIWSFTSSQRHVCNFMVLRLSSQPMRLDHKNSCSCNKILSMKLSLSWPAINFNLEPYMHPNPTWVLQKCYQRSDICFSSSACRLTSPLLVPHSTQMLAISNKILLWWSRDFHLQMLKSYNMQPENHAMHEMCDLQLNHSTDNGHGINVPLWSCYSLAIQYRLEISKLNQYLFYKILKEPQVLCKLLQPQNNNSFSCWRV
jgi:hypothetical protein